MSKAMTVAAFTHCLAPIGLPWSENAGKLKRMCQILTLPYHAVAAENHKTILCERFHRYLNKVEKIHAADCESLSQWRMGECFALYAWNASPIEGTDIIRSFAAK
jgi:hypothetical protein